MITSLPSGGPDDVPVTTPPGTLLISGAEGIEITVKAAEGTVIGVPYYWQSGVWQPLLGDATVAPRQVKAVAGGVDIGHLYFNKPATPLWFAVLETGGGTVGFCDIREAEGSTVLSQQDVTGSGGGGGPMSQNYTTTCDVSLNAATPFACFVISNPAMSGQILTIEDIQIPSEAGSCEWEMRRYDGIPSASGTAADANLWKTDTTQSAPTFGAKYATVDGDLDLTGLTCTWHRDVRTLLNDAGDDTSLLFYVPSDFKPVLQAGESLVLFCPVGAADYDINALIRVS